MVNQRRRSSTRGDDDVVDLRGVEAGGGRRSAHLPEDEGPYTFKNVKITREEGQDSGKAYLLAVCEVQKPASYKGKRIYHNLTLQPQGLFNLRGMMEACGLDAEKRLRVAQIITALTGKSFQANVEDDEYNGKVKSIITEYVLETPTRRRRQADEDGEDEEEPDDEDEDDEEDDDDEEEEEPPARSRRAAPSRTSASRNGRAAAAPRASRTASRTARRAASDDDDDDIDDLELEDL